ncbi:hypothetical protein [Tissierella sp.]|uniref:hypothetical protein n=1 Tax=Tissierella sp. TaxID=41274 RepID=UPI0028613498|nr:hypothetical protein [Tissierella sp.]MDR7856058.1 hypothetical protein [Tissierella sp.]
MHWVTLISLWGLIYFLLSGVKDQSPYYNIFWYGMGIILLVWGIKIDQRNHERQKNAEIIEKKNKEILIEK